MTKYILTIDYKAGQFPPYVHYELDSTNLLDAMREAEKQIEFENYVYQATISEKSGKCFKGSFGEKCTQFNAILKSYANYGWKTTERLETIQQNKYPHSTEYEFIDN